ncbi:PQQ-dependent sugar dehydrogenase [Aneurinibacillus migulanus]|uniref:PQQ-dependent sugar dehydrogenase n=1 Tax=Aneurinibacillus migulanus TaxID=47500 RepID=UPI00209F740A|nr:PQQ-dependent sugar dehydrogenase [Aneurinibacillus migulanus]MCP1357909.1 PQQ-dependent sugar dehydrogenase [Aneurinibacillus migulanus]
MSNNMNGFVNQAIPYRIEVVARGLIAPWAIDFAPDGRIFLTERPGRIRVVENGRLLPEPLITFSAPFVSIGEGGLLGLAVDPNFNANHFLYVYHSYRVRGRIRNRVVRLVERNNKATIDKILITNIPGNQLHNGGRLKIGPDGLLYITTGDAEVAFSAQNRTSLSGKILRIHLDGSIPGSNPFRGSPVYSLGHRNPQGLAWNPRTGVLYESEHGASGHDEINLIRAGANYGWPIIEGDERRRSLRLPLVHSGNRTWAPSGMTFVSRGPWRGQLLVANLRGSQILRFAINRRNPRSIRLLSVFFRSRGRIRDVVERSDGSLYVLTSNRDGRGQARPGDDKLFRLRLIR